MGRGKMKNGKEKTPYGANDLSKNRTEEWIAGRRSRIQVEGRQRDAMLKREALEALQSVQLEDVAREELGDLKSVVLGTEQSMEERLIEFVRQVKNPYLFRVGPLVVKIGAGGSGDFREALARGIVLS